MLKLEPFKFPVELNYVLQFRVKGISCELITEGNYTKGGQPFINAMYLTMSLHQLLTQVKAFKNSIIKAQRDMPTPLDKVEDVFVNVQNYLFLSIQSLPAFVKSIFDETQRHVENENRLLELVQELKNDVKNLKIVNLLCGTFSAAQSILNTQQSNYQSNQPQVDAWLKCVKETLETSSVYTLLELGYTFYRLVIQYAYCNYIKKEHLEVDTELKTLLEDWVLLPIADCKVWGKKMDTIVKKGIQLNLKLEFNEISALLDTSLEFETGNAIKRHLSMFQKALKNPSAISTKIRVPKVKFDQQPQIVPSPVLPPVAVEVVAPEDVAPEAVAPEAVAPEAVVIAPEAVAPEAVAPVPAPSIFSGLVSSLSAWLPGRSVPIIVDIETKFERIEKELSSLKVDLIELKTIAKQNNESLILAKNLATAELPKIEEDLILRGKTNNSLYLEFNRLIQEAEKMLSAANFKLGKLETLLTEYNELADILGKVKKPFLESGATCITLITDFQKLAVDKGALFETKLLENVMARMNAKVSTFVQSLVDLKTKAEASSNLQDLKQIQAEMKTIMADTQKMVSSLEMQSLKQLKFAVILKLQIRNTYFDQAKLTMSEGELALNAISSKILELEAAEALVKKEISAEFVKTLKVYKQQSMLAYDIITELESLSNQSENTENMKRKKFLSTQIDKEFIKWYDKVEGLRKNMTETLQKLQGLNVELYGEDDSKLQEIKAYFSELDKWSTKINNLFNNLQNKFSNLSSSSSPLFPEGTTMSPEEKRIAAEHNMLYYVQKYNATTASLAQAKNTIVNYGTSYNQVVNSRKQTSFDNLTRDLNNFIEKYKNLEIESSSVYAKIMKLGNFLNENERQVIKKTRILPWQEFESSISEILLKANIFVNNLSSVLTQNAELAREFNQRMVSGLTLATRQVSEHTDEIRDLNVEIRKGLNTANYKKKLMNQVDTLFEEIRNIMREQRLPTDVVLSEEVLDANSLLQEEYERAKIAYVTINSYIRQDKKREFGLMTIRENNLRVSKIYDEMKSLRLPENRDRFEGLYETVLELYKAMQSMELPDTESPDMINERRRFLEFKEKATNLYNQSKTEKPTNVQINEHDVFGMEMDEPEENEVVVFHRHITELVSPKTNQVQTALKLGSTAINVKECKRSNNESKETIYLPTMFTAEEREKCDRLQNLLSKATEISRKTNSSIDSYSVGFTYLSYVKLISKRGNNFVFGKLRPLLERIVVSIPGETLSGAYNLYQFLDNSLYLKKGESFSSLAKALLLNSHLFEPEAEAHQRLKMHTYPDEFDESRLLNYIGGLFGRSLVMLELKTVTNLEHPYEVNEFIYNHVSSSKAPYFVLKTIVNGEVCYAAMVPMIPGKSRGGRG
jgi:hypothetical protein